MTSSNAPDLHSMGYRPFRKRGVAWLMPWTPEINMNGVSVSAEDTPEPGGFVAVNPDNMADRWYVAKAFAEKNYEPVD